MGVALATRGVGVGSGVLVKVSGSAGLTLRMGFSVGLGVGELRRSNKRFSRALRSDGVGVAEGTILDAALGFTLGLAVGLALGLAVGFVLGLAVGFALGFTVGLAEGFVVGFTLGFADGFAVGLAEGLVVGAAEGVALALGAPKISLILTLLTSIFGFALALAAVEGVGFGLLLDCSNFSNSLSEELSDWDELLGFTTGLAVGFALGLVVGAAVGFADGFTVGFVVGFALGDTLGLLVGTLLGGVLGAAVGAVLLLSKSSRVGLAVGWVLTTGLPAVGVLLGLDASILSRGRGAGSCIWILKSSYRMAATFESMIAAS